ncbi:MAG: hypothetical protein GC181_15805 [Bacteroidetes bacterium]|nr:hypothetical protein [Bacteroidota bacterium]
MKKNILSTALTLFLGFSIWSCGDDPTPTTNNNNNNNTSDSLEEYIVLNGERFEGKNFKSKKIVNNPSTKELRISLKNTYPEVIIVHEKSGDTLLPRDYVISKWYTTDFDFDEFEVQLSYSEGPPPAYCQFTTTDEPPTPNGTYVLKMVDGKLISEFGKGYMTCVDGGDGKATALIEKGRLIWESK